LSTSSSSYINNHVENEEEFDYNEEGSFNVYITSDNIDFIKKLTLEYPNKETGGDLFGLWKEDGSVDIHHVIGPGMNAKRTSASFFQDSEYLKKAGEYLTHENFCAHIGDWHSHHCLGLKCPSHGDSCTCVEALLKYNRQWFVLFIVNILKNNEVQINPYRYTDEPRIKER